MNQETRKKLLKHFAELATDADAAPRSAKVFLPLRKHRLVLRREIAIVLGSRGAGKTAMFQLVRAMGSKLRAFYDDESIPAAEWVDAFSDALDHPAASVLDSFSGSVPQDTTLRAFWFGHLVGRLSDAGIATTKVPPVLLKQWENNRNNPVAWAASAEANAGILMNILDSTERELAAGERTVFATYDALDRIGDLDRGHRQRLVRTLLALWLTLSNRYRYLRAKIFLRHDLFEEAEGGFADASKLRARSESLDWDVEALFRLVVRHLANTGTNAKMARDWLSEIPGIALEDRGTFGFEPGDMDEPVRKTFATAVAGAVMGAGVKKGYTHRWIPDRLQDADGRIVPRSILRLFTAAAGHALNEGRQSGTSLMQPIDLSAALIETSRRRATELFEEYTVVQRLENLRGQTMLMERADVEKLLSKKTRATDPLPEDGELILDELRRIGVLEERADGRIDVPDIYRYGYGIKRKGGVRRPR